MKRCWEKKKLTIKQLNGALSPSWRVCSPISSILSSGFLLAFLWAPVARMCRCVHVTHLQLSSQCPVMLQVARTEPVHSATVRNYSHAIDTSAAPALMCFRGIRDKAARKSD